MRARPWRSAHTPANRETAISAGVAIGQFCAASSWHSWPWKAFNHGTLHHTLYYYYYLKGDYERALEFRRLHPDQQAIHAYIEYIPVYGQLGRTQEALENWRKLLAEDPGWTAESFKDWYRLWNMRDEDIAKLMDGVTKSGVLEAEAKPRQ